MAAIPLPLELLQLGERAEILDIQGSPEWLQRLSELGFREGAQIQMLQPGSPCLVLIGGARLSLRGEEASSILVQPVAAKVS